MITKKLIHWRVNNKNYSVHLYTPKPDGICFTVNINGTCYYAPMVSRISKYSWIFDSFYHGITLKVNNNIYYLFDRTPYVTIDYTVKDAPAPYASRYVVTSIKISLNTAINKKIQLQCLTQTSQWLSTSSWTTILEIPAKGLEADYSKDIRAHNANWRINIDGWTSEFTINTEGEGSKTIDIPEDKWGVE